MFRRLVNAGRRHFTPIVVLVVVSLALNFALARRVRLLEGVIARISADREVLKVGSQMQPAEVVSANKSTEHLRYSDTTLPTVVYVMSPECVWCRRNTQNMNALVAQSGRSYRVVIVSSQGDGIDNFRRAYGVTANIWPLAANVDNALRELPTPTTLLVSPTGKILAKWSGAFGDSVRTDIQKQLNVTLPGLVYGNENGSMVTPPVVRKDG